LKILGISASEGISIGKVLLYDQKPFIFDSVKEINSKMEVRKLEDAIERTKNDLNNLRKELITRLDYDHSQIFEVHAKICTDPELIKRVHSMIEKGESAALAYHKASKVYEKILLDSKNAYMRERAADIKDVSRRVVGYLLKMPKKDLLSIKEEVVIIAKELTPSDVAQLNPVYVKGYLTSEGGKTSHSSIMARSLRVPALVGVNEEIELANNNDMIILNGNEGYAILNPSELEINHHNEMINQCIHEENELMKYCDISSSTIDNKYISVSANIGKEDNLEYLKKLGIDGIGLFRTEFLCLGSEKFLTEEEQYKIYKKTLIAFKDKTVIIRTLDRSGDKQIISDKKINYYENKGILNIQIRALLRASMYGNLHIMFPMITKLEEFIDLKSLIKKCDKKLREEGHTISNDYKIGMMIEVPAAAILADDFANEADFISIGTNDLIQFLFKADRADRSLDYRYQPYHPSLLKLLKLVIDSAHKNGIKVSLCGEMASDETAVPLLIGLGLDNFSMNPSNILRIKRVITNTSYSNAKKLSIAALNKNSNQEVKELVEDYIKSMSI